MTKTWIIDPTHSSVGFSIKHMMIAKVHGAFKDFSGELKYDSGNLGGASVEATIQTASIDTRESKRDEHLRSADFFDVEKFPTLSFKSNGIKKLSDDEFKLVGELTIRDVTKEVELVVEGPSAALKDPWGNTKIGLSASTKINRKDFGLTWNSAIEAGGVLVGDEVKISLDLQFTEKA